MVFVRKTRDLTLCFFTLYAALLIIIIRNSMLRVKCTKKEGKVALSVETVTCYIIARSVEIVHFDISNDGKILINMRSLL